jgi:glycosyltransferase involved in cell wall biosynthesis
MERDNKNLNIKIITTAPFPIGMAGSNRIMTYAKGLIENNCNVCVVCMKTTENPMNVFNTSTSGIIDGIFYKYSTGKTIISSNVIRRRIDDFNGLLRTCIDLFKEKKTNKTDVIIFYSFSTSRALAIFFITRVKKILFIIEESEHPAVYTKKMFFLWKILFEKLHYQLFDGLLLMTKRLIKYFVEERKMKTPYLHVPMTVDLDRFNLVKKKGLPQYIAYCGVLNNEKDGVDILIDAFVLLVKEFPDINLYLIGNAASDEEHELYLEKVIQNNLTERIIFTGLVSKNKIPELLCNASLLVLPRPESIQADGGFPTKLGEYLATGNPVVVTKVGEIPEYLTDGVNVFMAEPGNIDSLYCKMRSALLDHTSALIIGENGKKAATESFNYKTQTKNIINFIKSFPQDEI